MKFREILAKAMRPRDGVSGLSVRAMDGDEGVEVLVYDQIGFWGITAEDFRRELSAIEADTIHLRLDCPGGDVFMARAMKTALDQHSARIVVHVDGYAASAASYLMLGGDEIEIARGAFVMIHNAWTIMLGNKHDLRDEAELLDKIDATILADYVTKTGKPEAEFIALMDKETWFEASEAVEIGLADRIYEKDGGANNRFDLSVFENAPAALTAPEWEETAAARRAAQMRKLDFYERLAP